jgi:hypothetical protein
VINYLSDFVESLFLLDFSPDISRNRAVAWPAAANGRFCVASSSIVKDICLWDIIDQMGRALPPMVGRTTKVV